MILGISLIVNESNKGQRLIFRYPEAIPNFVEDHPYVKGAYVKSTTIERMTLLEHTLITITSHAFS